VVLLPPPAAMTPSVVDASSGPFVEESLPMLEIRLQITINIVSRLNAAEETRSLSIKEVSLWEFLLDQILLLQESLELSLMPCIIEVILHRGWPHPGPPLCQPPWCCLLPLLWPPLSWMPAPSPWRMTTSQCQRFNSTSPSMFSHASTLQM
jgi:hypothetical protein